MVLLRVPLEHGRQHAADGHWQQVREHVVGRRHAGHHPVPVALVEGGRCAGRQRKAQHVVERRENAGAPREPRGAAAPAHAQGAEGCGPRDVGVGQHGRGVGPGGHGAGAHEGLKDPYGNHADAV